MTAALLSPPKVRARSRLVLGAAAILVFAAALAADRLSKTWALSALAGDATVPVLPGVRLELAFNPGAAFGMGANFGPAIAVGILVLLLALCSWVYWSIVRGNARWSLLFLALAAAGGWGNMYDRISRATGAPLSGTVIDMIAVDWFAIFNVADIFAVAGIITWAVLNLTDRKANPDVSR